MKLKDLENIVDEYMLRADKGIIRLICATMVSNYLPTPPSWMFIVGNSSGGKSMILSAMKPVTGVVEIDDMTAKTFASGMRGQSQNSLLAQMPKNGTLLIKDYTTMLSKDKESRAEILGQMRKIFDGDYRKKFGNGEDVQWSGKVGMIAGVTPEIYSQEVTSSNAAMGERYLYYQLEMPDRFEVAMMSTEEITDYKAKADMSAAFQEYLNPIIDDVVELQRAEGGFVMPKMDLGTRKELVTLAEFTTRARSAVKRNQYSRDKDQEMRPTLEMTPRFAKALVCVAYGLLLVHRYDGEPEVLTEGDKAILFKVALDSIPQSRRDLLEALTMYSTATENGLIEQLSMSRPFIKLYLGDLVAVGLVQIQKTAHSWQYILKEEYRQLMATYRGLNMGKQDLDGKDPDAFGTGEPLPTEEPPATKFDLTSEQAGLNF